MDGAPQASHSHEFEFEAVTGFFMQDDPATDAETFDYVRSLKHNLGLLTRSYPADTDSANTRASEAPTQWQRFTHRLARLNTPVPASPAIAYKLLYLARHGEGTHNVAEAFYGTPAWDAHWSKLPGNGTASWADAPLTAVGEEQAREVHAFLGEQFAWAGMPVPAVWWVSPLWRCLQTARLTWEGLNLAGFAPVVKELVRETLGEHTCDRRSTRTGIREGFPVWAIEDGFSEEDEFWRVDHRETHAEHDVRSRAILEELFAGLGGEGEQVVSFTAHSGTIASVLRVVGHREFRLPTGGVIPVLVKATRAR
ncbi:hypothetical protein LTR08_000748 [Meristemomyces frigidus]|nr:hypothetical protein LTR08_000748 [Meristemomyces frigidus]